MGYKVGADKRQLLLLPVSLEEYVPEDHICRVIYAFTKMLDMTALGYKYSECKETGCPPYDPRMMLNLYIYGYLHRVRSSRRLRDECKRNVEVMWLMDDLKPEDRAICNFRKDNTKALKGTFREFNRMCQEIGLYGGEIIATDSVKIRANNSLDNNHNKTTVNNALSRIDKKIDEYLKALEACDKEEAEAEAEQPSRAEIKVALERLKARKQAKEELKSRLETESEISTVDPDARLMRSGGDGRKLNVRYNVHTAVDSANHLVVDFEVTTCASDAGNLKTMTDKSMEVMEVTSLTNLADAGYYDSKDIVACEESGITCLVAKPATGGPKKTEGFNREDFIYDREKDVYRCPCGQELEYKGNRRHISGREYRVYSDAQTCRKCNKKAECTSSEYREYLRLTCQDILDRVDERTRTNKGLYRKRQEIVEHCFGTIKAVWGYRQFLCRTKEKVGSEMALTYMAYNIMRRFFNIITTDWAKIAAKLA